ATESTHFSDAYPGVQSQALFAGRAGGGGLTWGLEKRLLSRPCTAVNSGEVVAMSVRQRNEDRGVELGTGVSWPLVCMAGGLGVLVLGTGIVLAVLTALRPAPAPDPVLAQQGKSFHLPELSDPPPRPRVSRPIEAAEPEPPEMLPRPAIVAPELASVVRLIEPPPPRPPTLPPPGARPVVIEGLPAPT